MYLAFFQSLLISRLLQSVQPDGHCGGSSTYTVSTSAVAGFTGPVTLSVSGLPSGATASFSSNNFATPGSSTLTVKTSSSTPARFEHSDTHRHQRHSLAYDHRRSGRHGRHLFRRSVISIDFATSGNAMSSSEVAGVVAKPNWNSAVGSSGSGLALLNESGTSSGATLSWSTSHTSLLACRQHGRQLAHDARLSRCCCRA